LFWRQLVGPGLAALLAAQLTKLDGRRVFVVGLALRQFGLTRGHVHDEFRKLVEVSGAFAFWHDYNMTGPDRIFHLLADNGYTFKMFTDG
jgi:hypothetical protein